MQYSEAIEFLYGLRLFGSKFGLENTFALAALCGNPHQQLRFIHVAGTNGKGSVCAMLESVYRASGLRVGLFTSPHLVSFTERIQVDRSLIPEEAVARLVGRLAAALGGDRESWTFRPTFFEFVTVLSLVYFVEQRCDLVIWETGLGGRLDATNIVTPLASVITNIQLDHQQWLGSTLVEIAREKAGIVKPGVPVITGAEPGGALKVIRERARELHAPFISTVERAGEFQPPVEALALAGRHQQANAAVALASVQALQPVLPVSREQIRRGLSATSWPGRLQQVRIGATTVLLDGAHNPDGARSLARALQDLFPGRDQTLVLGLFQDKEWREICDILIPGIRRLYLVPIQSERALPVAELQEYCSQRWPELEIRAAASSGAAVDAALRFPFVVVAGSLHLIGEVMQHLRVMPGPVAERGLNEWDAGRRGSL